MSYIRVAVIDEFGREAAESGGPPFQRIFTRFVHKDRRITRNTSGYLLPPLGVETSTFGIKIRLVTVDITRSVSGLTFMFAVQKVPCSIPIFAFNIDNKETTQMSI